MMGTVTKFQCQECGGIVVTEFDDEMVGCGYCDAVCRVPNGFEPGLVIDDFIILQKLGQGGMGDVFLAHQITLDRVVALKILKDKFLVDPKFKTEFLQEARAVASLNHPNIIQAYKVGDYNGILFFAMEYVEGQNLADILKVRGIIDQEMVIDLAIDVAKALGYAWTKAKLVHRDIKPDNIMVTVDNSAKVMDLGLSRKGEETEDDSDVVSGTPQYISPEQIVGTPMDVRGDFYSLGASMYHLLSGQYVFNGPLEEMIRMHIQDPVIPVRKINPSVNIELSRVITKLLGKLPEERYQTSEELERALVKAKKAIKGTKTGKVKKISVKGTPGSTGKNTSSASGKFKAGSSASGKFRTGSQTKAQAPVSGKFSQGKTGRSSISFGANKPGSTGRNEASSSGKSPAAKVPGTTSKSQPVKLKPVRKPLKAGGAAATGRRVQQDSERKSGRNTGREKDRDRDKTGRARKEEKKKDPMLPILFAVGAILLIGIIIVVASGGDDKKTDPPPKVDNTDKPDDNKPGGGTPKVNPLLNDPDLMKAVTVNSADVTSGLKYKYYEHKVGKTSELNGKSIKKQGDVHTFTLDIRNSNRGNDFGFVYEGYLVVPKTAEYTFYLSSDDGSVLHLGGKKVVDNDGLHGFDEKKGNAKLEKGLHKFKLMYFQQGNSKGLDLQWSNGKSSKTRIRPNYFRCKK